MGMEIPWEWESHGNENESKNESNEAGNEFKKFGMEWELNRWEWEGIGMLKAIPAHCRLIEFAA